MRTGPWCHAFRIPQGKAQYHGTLPRRSQPRSSPQPATPDSGFVLSTSPLGNPYTSDLIFQRILSWYLPPHVLEDVVPQLKRFGDETISSQVWDWISDAERHPPTAKQYNVWGRRNDPDRLLTSWGWKEAGRWGISNG
jgi:hypothetical protein